MKKPHNRKLLLLFDDRPHTIQLPPAPPSFTFTNSHLPHLQPNTTVHNATSPSSSPLTKKPLKTTLPSPTFDSSMALTLLVLLTALFFMGFFSIYIRRFDDDSTVDISRRRRRHHHHRDPPQNSSSPSSPSYQPSMLMTLRRGLDPAAFRSLPVYSYRGDAKYQIECLICLGEFEENETVKMIPFCKHLFHLRCIDKWFASHVTCPVCRGTQLFEEVKIKERFDQGVSELNGRSTMENGDTCTEVRDVGTLGLRRANSCSNLSGERVSLQRTSSF